MKIGIIVMMAGVFALALGTAARAQPAAAVELYRLDTTSTYEHGCLPPCMCPSYEASRARGTFTLIQTTSDPLYTNYAISEVNWLIETDGRLARVTGSGTYRIGGEVALLQEMVLSLSIDGGPPQTLQSGLVPGGSTFPRISIDVSINGGFCYDTVFRLDASPVPVTERRSYTLSRSLQTDSCVPPCDCPTRTSVLAGGFALVPLGPATTPVSAEFAVVNASFRAVSPAAPTGSTSRGFGLYLMDGINHRMMLSLTSPTGTAAGQRLDSGWVETTTRFPKIDIDVETVNPVCAALRLELHAVPARPTAGAAQGLLLVQPAPETR